MSDLIDRQAAINALICKMRPHNNGDGTITICVMSEGLVRETLNDLPSAEPRKKGKWVHHERGLFVGNKCSECGELNEFYTKYCPHCGSHNGGKQE